MLQTKPAKTGKPFTKRTPSDSPTTTKKSGKKASNAQTPKDAE